MHKVEFDIHEFGVPVSKVTPGQLFVVVSTAGRSTEAVGALFASVYVEQGYRYVSLNNPGHDVWSGCGEGPKWTVRILNKGDKFTVTVG